MGFINKEEVKAIKKMLIEEFTKKKGWKFSVRGANTSTLEIDIITAPLDYLEPYQIQDKRLDVAYILNNKKYDGVFSVLLERIKSIAQSKGWYNITDEGTDYRQMSYYIDIGLGHRQKGFTFIECKETEILLTNHALLILQSDEAKETAKKARAAAKQEAEKQLEIEAQNNIAMKERFDKEAVLRLIPEKSQKIAFAAFPTYNKNDTLEIYQQEFAAGEYRNEKIQAIAELHLPKDLFEHFRNNLLNTDCYGVDLSRFGGTGSFNADLVGADWTRWTEKEISLYNERAYRVGIKIYNGLEEGSQFIYVDSQGYTYARYVGFSLTQIEKNGGDLNNYELV